MILFGVKFTNVLNLKISLSEFLAMRMATIKLYIKMLIPSIIITNNSIDFIFSFDSFFNFHQFMLSEKILC